MNVFHLNEQLSDIARQEGLAIHDCNNAPLCHIASDQDRLQQSHAQLCTAARHARSASEIAQRLDSNSTALDGAERAALIDSAQTTAELLDAITRRGSQPVGEPL